MSPWLSGFLQGAGIVYAISGGLLMAVGLKDKRAAGTIQRSMSTMSPLIAQLWFVTGIVYVILIWPWLCYLRLRGDR